MNKIIISNIYIVFIFSSIMPRYTNIKNINTIKFNFLIIAFFVLLFLLILCKKYKNNNLFRKEVENFVSEMRIINLWKIK